MATQKTPTVKEEDSSENGSRDNSTKKNINIFKHDNSKNGIALSRVEEKDLNKDRDKNQPLIKEPDQEKPKIKEPPKPKR